MAETDRLHTMSVNLVASAVVPESNRLLAVSESLAVSGASGGHSAWRSRVGGLRWEMLLWNPCRHLTMLTMSKHEVLVAHMVSMSCMVHARIHVWVHMLHAWVRLGCTVHEGIQGTY